MNRARVSRRNCIESAKTLNGEKDDDHHQLIYFDLDNLQLVNDTFGREAGDGDETIRMLRASCSRKTCHGAMLSYRVWHGRRLLHILLDACQWRGNGTRPRRSRSASARRGSALPRRRQIVADYDEHRHFGIHFPNRRGYCAGADHGAASHARRPRSTAGTASKSTTMQEPEHHPAPRRHATGRRNSTGARWQPVRVARDRPITSVSKAATNPEPHAMRSS